MSQLIGQNGAQPTIEDLINFLNKQSASYPSILGVTDLGVNATQAIPNSPSVPAVNTFAIWNVANSDPLSTWNPVTDASKIIVPSGANAMRFYAHVEWATNAVGYRSIRMYNNGAATVAPYTSGGATCTANGTISDHQTSVVPFMRVTPGDALQLNCFQNSGGSLNILNTSAVRCIIEWLHSPV